MSDAMILRQQDAFSEPLPHQDYSLHLLQYAAEHSLLDMNVLTTLRDGLHQAAAERAAQYTAGRSTTVTRKQAEAFYASVLTQLDAALLSLKSDSAALMALQTQSLTDLLEQGAMTTLQAYELAKEQFRKAYQLTKPVQTSFFHALLLDFEQFCTKYDARFHAKDTKVSFSYPLLCDRQLMENGAIGVCSYYTSLYIESEFLHCFDTEEICAMMQRYADLFRTTPDMIAENIAELVLRHWAIHLLCGLSGFSVTISPEAIETVQAECHSMPAAHLAKQLRQSIAANLDAAHPAVIQYLTAALPDFVTMMQARMEQERLAGWLAPLASNSEPV